MIAKSYALHNPAALNDTELGLLEQAWQAAEADQLSLLEALRQVGATEDQLDLITAELGLN